MTPSTINAKHIIQDITKYNEELLDKLLVNIQKMLELEK